MDGDGRGPRTTPTGLVCRGKPLDSREETTGALNMDLGRLSSPVGTTATFAERIEPLVDLEPLLGFDLRFDLELRDDIDCLVNFGPDCGAFSIIGECADNIDAHDRCVAHCGREGTEDVGERTEDGTEWRILMRSLP